jgi:hypothetical protein
MKKILICGLLLLWGVDSSLAGISIMGDLAQEQSLQPGEKFEGTINLKNTGPKACQVNVYQTDYLFYADGTNIYDKAGNTSRSNASWISVGPSRLTILPDQTASVYYTVQVPEPVQLASGNNEVQVNGNSLLIGTYWSMVMIEPVPETGTEEIEDRTGRVTMGIQTRIRYGIQIITNIGDTGTREIKFENKKLFSQDGRTFLQMDITNFGQRWLYPNVWLELYNQEGKNLGHFESDQKRIYPGCSVRHKIELPNALPGKYQALIVADNGDDYVFGAKYNLEIK